MADSASNRLLVVFPVLKLLVHLATIRGYGMFRDEFYYLACADRLAWGYVDHPPLSIAFLAGWRVLFGDSIVALRLPPALAGAATVLLVGLIARRLGGGPFALALAMLAALIAPLYLALDHFYSMNAFDLLFWAAAAYVLVRILQDEDARWWIVLGVVFGLGLLNKISLLWLDLGIGVGLVLTPARRLLLTRGPWIAAAIAGMIFLPHVLWQFANGWPTLEFMHNARTLKMAETATLEFLGSQVRDMHPLNALVWAAGLVWLLASRRAERVRPLGWAYLAVFVLLATSGAARSGYLAPAYSWLLAAGGVAVEEVLALPVLRVGALAALAAGGIATAPFAIPVLPVERYIAYARAAGVEPDTEEKKELAELPQFYADMFGWERIVGTVASVYDALPAEDKARAAIVAPNYGVAGAIDHLGRAQGLPPAISGHNNYWLWGPRGHDGSVVIVIGGRPERLGTFFTEFHQAATIACGRCMPYENGRPVWVCRGPKLPMAEIWARSKNFN